MMSSTSLLSRQVGMLKHAQRLLPQILPGRATGNVISWRCSAAPSSCITPVGAPQLSLLRHHGLGRNFSAIGGTSGEKEVMEQNELDDDGGPIVGNSEVDMTHMTDKELADMSSIPGWNLVHSPPRCIPRGALVGKVVSDKMQKTVNVAVDRYRIVPKYRKRLKYTKKFMAHDEREVCNMGDLVMIVPCQKISRHKHFMVREIIRAKGQL